MMIHTHLTWPRSRASCSARCAWLSSSSVSSLSLGTASSVETRLPRPWPEAAMGRAAQKHFQSGLDNFKSYRLDKGDTLKQYNEDH